VVNCRHTLRILRIGHLAPTLILRPRGRFEIASPIFKYHIADVDPIADNIKRMPLIRKKMFNVMFLMVFIGLFSGCAHLFPPPQEQSQARQILNRLTENNAGLERFKALAHVRMERDGQIVSGRIAVAATVPNKLRIEWLNLMGQPLTSLSGDGEMITVFSRSDNQVHRLRQSSTAMEPLIHIPIGIEDLQKILLGRIPFPADAAVQLKESPNEIDILILKNRWHNIVTTLQVDRQTLLVLAMKAFNGQGDLLYEVRWGQWQNEGEYLVPFKVVFESESRQRLILTVDRFWPDVDVPESIFKLDVP
jgi:outer membrane biogenesis lipoprotein LolB